MKLIKIPKPPCDHTAKAEAFHAANGGEWPVGTRIECDCGAHLQLKPDPHGPYWALVSRLTVLV